jgi:hypothetical protein
MNHRVLQNAVNFVCHLCSLCSLHYRERRTSYGPVHVCLSKASFSRRGHAVICRWPYKLQFRS